MVYRRGEPVQQTLQIDSGEEQVVTAVIADPRTPGYEIVELNGTRFASLPAHLVSGSGLGDGTILGPDRLDRLTKAADIEAAYRVAVRLLAARPRSVVEMQRSLSDRGHRPAAVAGAIARLTDQQLLDDTEYARHFARVRGGKGHGRFRIVADLRARGVDAALAAAAVAEVLEEEGIEPLEQARVLARKRLAQLADLPPATQRRRVLAFLSRRGYQGWEVRELVDGMIGLE